MKISSFLSLIEQFSQDQKKELLQLSELVSNLYSRYGNTLCEKSILSEVKHVHPETASYIELIVSTIGLEHCHELYKELLQHEEDIICSYHSTDESLLTGISKAMQ